MRFKIRKHPVRKDLKLQGAGGGPIRTCGVRRVQLHADQSTSFPMDFVIADVTRPIISVIQLQATGIIASFAKSGCHLRTGQHKWITLKRGEDTLSYFCPQGISEALQRTVSKIPSQVQAQVIYANVKEEEPSSSSGWTNDDSTGRDDPLSLIHI